MATFVLVPGAGGQAWFWHRLVPELARRGHDAVAVELPAGDDDAGLAAYADTVVAAAHGRADLVLVAQSMGGLVAPLACGRLPVRLLVLLNAMIPRPGETGGDWWEITGRDEAATEHARRHDPPYDPHDEIALFFHDVPPEVTAAAMAQPIAQSGRPFEDPWPLERWPAVPTRVLAGRNDRLFPLDFQRALAAERLGLEVDEIPGGHCAALSRPAELADRLVGYVDEPDADDGR
jgi:pimeloyl-ACP methyl ester carboxylesterase